MELRNVKIFVGRHFITGDIAFQDTVTAVRETGGAWDGRYVIPGLVDIHTHGAVGEDFSDGRPGGLQPLSDYYAANGVTSYLATTMTLPEAVLADAMRAIRDFRRRGGAKCAGVHLEGPFLSMEKRGAQAAGSLRRPDAAMFRRLNEASGGLVRLVTVACEEPGALAFIQEVSGTCTVSLGHTAADYDTAMEAFRRGATHVTHLFNGMSEFLHRAPGVAGAALDSGASVELICDGIHVHPSVIRAAARLFGERLNLISDSLRCAGMPDGDYELGGQPVLVRDRRATLPDGTIAGSSISVMDALRNVARYGIPLEEAVYAASTAPALAVGIDVGRIAEGKAADLVVLDSSLGILDVYVDGRRQRTAAEKL